MLTLVQIATTSSSRNSSKSNMRDNGRRASRKGSQNKPLPTPPTPQVPVLLANPQTDSRPPLDVDGEARGRPISRVPHYQPQQEPVNPYMAGNAQPKVEAPASPPQAPISRPDVHVPSRPTTKQPEYHHEAWHSEEQRKAAAPPHTDSSRIGHKRGHRQSMPNKDGDSPPTTAKDSAYSSLSGASIMSPASTAPPPRSASSNAHFGLFPSSAQHTPKQSMSGRLGIMTPTSSNLRSVKSADPPDRPPTSTSAYSETTSKRLLKRSSLQSLRRFFTKKKNDIHTIAE